MTTSSKADARRMNFLAPLPDRDVWSMRLDYTGKIGLTALKLGCWISNPAKWLRLLFESRQSAFSQFRSLSQKCC